MTLHHIYPEEHKFHIMERVMAQQGVSGYLKRKEQTKKELDEAGKEAAERKRNRNIAGAELLEKMRSNKA